MDENELEWDWGLASGSDTPHVFLTRHGENYLTLPMTPQNSEKVEELARLLNAKA